MGGQKPHGARKKPRKKKKKRRPVGKPSLAVLRRGFRLLRELFGRIGIRYLELDLVLGSDDPATTGEMVGFSAPFVALANSLPHTSVTLSPDFGGARFDGMGAGEIRVQPIQLLAPLFAFALSPEVRKWLLTRR